MPHLLRTFFGIKQVKLLFFNNGTIYFQCCVGEKASTAHRNILFLAVWDEPGTEA